MSRVIVYRAIAFSVNMMMTFAVAFFIIVAGVILAAFVVSLPVMDVYIQWRGMMADGWSRHAALALSIATSAVPLVYSMAGKGSIRGFFRGEYSPENMFVTLLLGVRLIDALLDAFSVGPAIGASSQPTLAWLKDASVFDYLTVLVVFILSNVTDEGKTVAIHALEGYKAFVDDLVTQVSFGARRGKPRHGTGSGSTETTPGTIPGGWAPSHNRGVHYPGRKSQ